MKYESKCFLLALFALAAMWSCSSIPVTITEVQKNYDQGKDPSKSNAINSTLQREFSAIDSRIPDDKKGRWNMLKIKAERLFHYRQIYRTYKESCDSSYQKNKSTNTKIVISNIVFSGLSTFISGFAAANQDSNEWQIASQISTISSGAWVITFTALNDDVNKNIEVQKQVLVTNDETLIKINEKMNTVENYLEKLSSCKNDEMDTILTALSESINQTEKVYTDIGLLKEDK